MDYRKIIKNRKTRMMILDALSFVPDPIMVKLQYRIQLGRKLNLKKPLRYTEKLQWLKCYYRDPLMTMCVDKYTVRDYVSSKGFKDILVDCYGVYDRFEEIPIDQLPNEFVLKKTNGGGGLNVLLCQDKHSIDLSYIESQLREWLRPSHNRSGGREWAYDNIKSRIIAEELLKDPTHQDNSIDDYKFLCFGGKVYCIAVDIGRFSEHKRNFYSAQWELLDVVSELDNFNQDLQKPKNLEKMVEIAEKLSEDFPEVRVDLYNINGKIYFGELTFYPWSGYVQFSPDEFDYVLGNEFMLPQKGKVDRSKQ